MSVQRLSLAEARARITAALGEFSSRRRLATVALDQARGRLLDQPVIAGLDLPGMDSSAMDGFALAISSLAGSPRLRLVGESLAGHPFRGRVAAGEAVRIATGALLPDGCDTVVVLERCTLEGQWLEIERDPAVRRGEHIRRRGEAVARGDQVLDAGTRLDFRHLGLLAALGHDEVQVRDRIRVALFSSGDELRAPGRALDPASGFDANRPLLAALLRRRGVELVDGGILADDPGALARAFDSVAERVDLIVTTGGVSLGPKDHLRDALAASAGLDFWRVAMKPGQAMAFGRWRGVALLALPGNPLAALVGALQLVLPALSLLEGGEATPRRVHACLDSAVEGRRGRCDLLLGVCYVDATARCRVRPLARQNSHMLGTLAGANCLIELDEERERAEPGEVVSIQPFGETP
ncbi:molybdopterin molybdotransferase MoeA [Halotalea alkalilenta]|uniref:Molybdopterin molybdenumtransferase n=1 Tax=Halotalea alkalilenta TaxID=376489 RepID=A0A172YEF4_9GAMM|nr:gephyrin-like molybdotransferase Glp [Halotalea alkalilenta]ANF57650.1 hypothetical protein A5892_09405 [Halotalea alkalilenta]